MHLSRMPSFEELLKPPPAYYPKNIYYKFYSLFLKTIGMFSEGMRIGFTHGFDSGMIMNYVCQNTPSGRRIIYKREMEILPLSLTWLRVKLTTFTMLSEKRMVMLRCCFVILMRLRLKKAGL